MMCPYRGETGQLLVGECRHEVVGQHADPHQGPNQTWQATSQDAI